MYHVRIAHIGDIHYPDHPNRAAVDSKDAAFPPALSNRIATLPMQAMMRHLVARSSTNGDGINAIALCGDLTSRGEMSGYDSCVQWLRNALNLTSTGSWNLDRLHVVPGNHDIDRSKIDKSGTYSPSKFSEISDCWKRHVGDILAVDRFRSTTVSGSKAANSLSLISLNSCLGCGEWRARLLPSQVPPSLKAQLEQYFDMLATANLDFQRLDTPAFDAGAIEDVCDHIRKQSANVLPIVVAHHNLLPQFLPRVDLYTEVINGGLARNRLAKCHRPVIYLHGHIHQDPVEIISPNLADHNHASCLISVSAPELSTGFNIIDIEFSFSGVPLGVVINRVRVEADGRIADDLSPIRVSFYSPDRASKERVAGEHARGLLKSLRKSDKVLSFNDIKSLSVGSRGRAQSKKHINSALLELEWLGFISIENRDRPLDRWHVKVVQP